MSRNITIYCEGEAGSHDFDIISKIIDGLSVKITPIGGKRGAKSAIQVHERGTSKSDFKMFFRDRDFDKPVPDKKKLTIEGYVYFSYRTTIENYLIDIDLIKKYYEKKSWDTENLESTYYQAAKNIKYFQAMRHALGKLRIPTDFGTNIVEKSGHLPIDLSKDYCKEKGFNKIKESLKKTNSWNKKNYDEQFDHFSTLFSDDFIESNKFLVYFQGKDYMKSLSCLLPEFSPKDYYNYAKANFDYTKFEDLVELRKIIESEI